MKNHIYCLLILGVLLIGSSCTLSLTRNIHSSGVDEKGELAVSGATGLNRRVNNGFNFKRYHQFQFQAAYSPIKHLVVSTSNSLLIPKDREIYSFKSYDLDFALGTYKRFNYKELDNNGFKSFLFDAYLSYGQSQFTSNYNDQGSVANFNKYALQLGIHHQHFAGRSKKYFYKIGFIYRPVLSEFTRLHLIGELSNQSFIENLSLDQFSIEHKIALQAEFGVEVFRVFYRRYNAVSIPGTLRLYNGSNQIGVILNLNVLAKKGNN